MSLQLWLPLNGDLTNNGLMDADATSTRLTYTEDGKIGKCARFNNNTYIDLGTVSIGKEFSICGWFNIITHNVNWATCVQLYNSDTNLISFCTLYNTTQNYASFNAQKNGTYIFDKYHYPFTLNQWNHFCVTVKDKKVNMYVNGQISYQGDMTDTPLYGEYKLRVGNRFIGSYYPNFKLNDFRVYDHCLSPKEVKEISKGLMLHYPLDNCGLGCKNLLAGNFNSIATKNGPVNTGTLWVNTASIPGGTLNNLIGKTLVFSYEVSCKGTRHNIDTSNLNYRYGIHACLSANGSGFELYPFANFLTYSGGPRKVVMKYTIPTTVTYISNLTFALQATNYPASDNNEIWYIKNCKLEIADEATPWCPNEADELYSQLGMDDNIEYDTSGYGNNGTKIGTLEYESNSPRYQSATYFNGTDAYIKAPQLTLDFNGVSFSMWYNIKSRSNWMRLFDFGNAKEGKAFTFGLGLYGEAATNLYFFGRYADLTSIDASTGYSLNKLNTWYHIACTISKGTVKIYVNGSLIKTLTLSKLPTGSQTMTHNLLAESNWSADPCSNCRISDFRIYATCLSDSDIQELYNKPISIDNQGTMFAVEAVEEPASPVKFNKTGVIEANQIGEYLHNYFAYDNPMTTDILQRVSMEKLIENNGLKLTCTSAVTSYLILHRMRNLMFNGASGDFKVEFDAWSTNPITIVCDICDKTFGTYDLTAKRQHFSGVAQGVNGYNTSSSYNGFFDIASSSVALGTEIYITNIVITKNTPKSIGSNYIVMDDIIEC